MNPKDNTNIELISGIDDDIIERNAEKRFKLFPRTLKGNGFGKKVLIIAVAAALILSLMCAILIPLLIKQKPEYLSMSISHSIPDSITSESLKGNESLQLTLLGNGNNKDKDKNKGNKDDTSDTLTQAGSDEIFYATQNQDVYIIIRLSNPDNYVIDSFTLNGKKYAHYMFEEGSDMETLILKYNVGDAIGLVEYTLDAIQYLDGTENKDVKLHGNRTVKVGIQPEIPASVENISEKIENNTFYLSFSISDSYDLIGSSENVRVELYDNDGVLVEAKIPSALESSDISFELSDSPAYTYKIIATYDPYGTGKAVEQILFTKTLNIQFEFSDGVITKYIGSSDKVVIPEHIGGVQVTELSADMFSERTDITSITIPSRIQTVNSNMLSECENITHANIPAALIAFLPKDSLVSITVNSGEAIPPECFKGIVTLEKVTLSEGITYIGNRAFSGCYSLKNISLPGTLDYVGHSAFYGCENLSGTTFENGIYLGNTEEPYIYLHAITDYSITSFVVNESTKFIGADFYNIAVYKISLPYSLISVDGDFNENILSGTVYENAVYLGNENNPYLYLWRAVNKNITSVTIHESTKIIGRGSFMDCVNLTSVEIPDGVVSIESHAFSYCNSLSTIAFGKDVRHIGLSAFDGTSLSNDRDALILPESLIYLDSIFADISRPRSLVIPTSVKYMINDYFTSSCYCYFTGTPVQWESIEKNSENYWRLYFYSKIKPTDTDYQYWYYSEEGFPAQW